MMDKSFVLKPKSGDYFQGHDVKPQILPPDNEKNYLDLTTPKPPLSVEQKKLWDQQLTRIASGKKNELDAPIIQPPPQSNNAKPSILSVEEKVTNQRQKGNVERPVVLPAYLRFFLSPTLRRAEENPATAMTVHVTSEEKDSKHHQEFHLVICWYQFCIGALGGVAVGIETGFFSAGRLSNPEVPVPEKMNFIKKITQSAVQASSSVYRASKRAVIAGFLFNFIDKNVEEYRRRQSFWNMGISGAITGAIFGLRGGYKGAMSGFFLLAAFSTFAGYQYYEVKKRKRKH